MNYKSIAKNLGKYLFYFSFVLCVPLLLALYYEFVSPGNHPQEHSSLEFFETLLICLGISFILLIVGRKSKGDLLRRESILLVILIWIVSAFVAALPFYLTKTLENPADAYFEAMSGLTTTGSTVMHPKSYDEDGKEIKIHITNYHVPEKTYSFFGTIKPVRDPKTNLVIFTGVEAVGKSLLFWRSFIQWLGGMGIVVLFIAVLPALTVGGKYLYQMEVPGPTKDTIVPRIRQTASILWKIYLFLTIVQIYLLFVTNPKMPLFDAFCITFSTLSTGGFSVTNESIGAYHNAFTDWIIIIFMLIGSVNFAIYFYIIKRQLFRIYEPDFLFFLLTAFIGSAIVILSIVGHQMVGLDGSVGVYSVNSAIRDGTFQAVSSMTSTGFASTDYDRWPFGPQIILLILMFIGGMSGSTAGGIKTSRIYILGKIVVHKIKSVFSPDEVKKLKIGKQEIDNKTATTVLAFFVVVIFFAILGTVIFTFNGVDPETSLSIMACTLNNVGLTFRAAGPTSSLAFLSDIDKVFCSLWMLLGRLEYFSLLLLFVPSFWKKN
jgi:trk system potassium uptake protein TrkH